MPVTTIDLLTASLRSKPTYIKCDAEGADYDILLGGQEYLQKFRPKITVTTYHNTGDFDRITAYLEGIGYKTSGKGIMYVAGEAPSRYDSRDLAALFSRAALLRRGDGALHRSCSAQS